MTRLKRKYQRLIDDLSRETEQRYLEYLLAQPQTFILENLVFDLRHLDRYYNCDRCRRKKSRAYCCRGHDLQITEADVSAIEAVLPHLAGRWPRLGRRLERGGFWHFGDEFERLMRRKANNDCIFLLPGGRGCCLHAWAIEAGRDPFQVKPYICSLYPLVVVPVGDQVVITSVSRESEKILEVGDGIFPCCTSRGKPEDHLLVRSRDMLALMFGQQACGKLQDRVFGKKTGRA